MFKSLVLLILLTYLILGYCLQLKILSLLKLINCIKEKDNQQKVLIKHRHHYFFLFNL